MSEITVLKLKCTKATFNDSENQEYLRFDARYEQDSEDNKSWSKFTPSGHLEFVVSNPAVFGKFEVGKDYAIAIKPFE